MYDAGCGEGGRDRLDGWVRAAHGSRGGGEGDGDRERVVQG